jgi:hypothetical protein
MRSAMRCNEQRQGTEQLPQPIYVLAQQQEGRHAHHMTHDNRGPHTGWHGRPKHPIDEFRPVVSSQCAAIEPL